ncbi:MAG TPA: hypothetical protein VH561_01715 [Micromonosporaceae bacterium]|jgi:hypothetical protein
MTLAEAVAALHASADLLGEAAQKLPTIDPGPAAFGTDGPGVLGEAGRETYLRWQSALDARAREARSHAARIWDLVEVVGRAAGGLAEADEQAVRAHRDGSAQDGAES